MLLALADNLPKARRLVLSAPLTAADGGEGGDYTLSVDGATASARGIVKLTGQLGGTADAPDVRGLRTTSGPTLLSFGAVADGQVLKRSGTSVVGGDVVGLSSGALTGDLDAGAYKVTNLSSGTATGDAATYGQVVSIVNGLDWQASVLDKDLASPPGSPTTGDRYLLPASPTGAWSGHGKAITTWSGSAWTFVAPNKGMTVQVEDEGADYNYNGSTWVNIGASVDHAALLNLTAGDPHTQYQLKTGKDAASGYAGLNSSSEVIKAVRQVRVVGSDPGSPDQGEMWVNGADLKFQDNQGSPVKQTVERVANKGVNGGYAGLDGSGKVSQPPATHASSHATAGTDAITPGAIGAVATSRNLSAGTGLGGGGDLTADRTLSISGFTGVVIKDIDPPIATWTPNEVKVHLTVDAGVSGELLPVAIRLPATVSASLRTEVVFEFHDTTSTPATFNANQGSVFDLAIPNLLYQITGDLTTNGMGNNGRSVRKIIFQTRNTTGNTVSSIDVAAYRLRAWALPHGGGSPL